MADVTNDIEEQGLAGLGLQHYLGIVRRRHLHFLIPLFLAGLLVWGASWVLPPRYQSSTLILVEQPTMPKDYVTPNVNDDLQERLQSITQQILSRTRLLHIIDQVQPLRRGARASSRPTTRSNHAERYRYRTGARRSNRDHCIQCLYYRGAIRSGQQVTGELTNLFINENLEVQQQQSEGTTQFLEAQLETARQSLSEQEDEDTPVQGGSTREKCRNSWRAICRF